MEVEALVCWLAARAWPWGLRAGRYASTRHPQDFLVVSELVGGRYEPRPVLTQPQRRV
ncbi:hypothetical protein [Streptomyces sp. NPDC017993]|uniref:hypothetical protein n=1 Tax=Streptomyces sp. NPDC017993 TaxID=3365027 RepID=UPI0037AC035D